MYIRGLRGYFSLTKLILKSRNYNKVEYEGVTQLVSNHFESWSTEDHVNRPIFQCALSELNQKPALIIETGTSAWGTDSTRIWDSYIRKFGGLFITIDIRPEPSRNLIAQLSKNSKCYVGDSVEILTNLSELSADLYYLDSYDLDLNNPFPSASHGLNEFVAIEKNLKPGALILIDDTPSELRLKSMPKLPTGSKTFIEKYGVNPGKGAFILQYLEKRIKYEILFHDYAILIKVL
jgi:hypothetical protein